MLNEITITAKFVTGTTIQDPALAEKEIRKLFLRLLEQSSIVPQEEGNGVFSVEILKLKLKKI